MEQLHPRKDKTPKNKHGGTSKKADVKIETDESDESASDDDDAHDEITSKVHDIRAAPTCPTIVSIGERGDPLGGIEHALPTPPADQRLHDVEWLCDTPLVNDDFDNTGQGADEDISE